MTVSVIIPVYNRPEYLDRAVMSALAQDGMGDDLDVIVVDDGSEPPLTQSWQYSDPRVRVLAKEHTGQSESRHRAAMEARGEYLAFLDSDDAWLPGKLRLQLDYLCANPSVGLCYTAVELVNADGSVRRSRYDAEGRQPLVYQRTLPLAAKTRAILTDAVLSSVVMRRDIYLATGGFDGRLNGGEDFDLFLKAADHADIAYLPSVTVRYLCHEGGIHLDDRRMESSAAILFDAMRDRRALSPQDANASLSIAWRHFYLGLAVPALREGDPGKARIYFRRVLERVPFSGMAIAGYLLSFLPALTRGLFLLLRTWRSLRAGTITGKQTIPD